MSEAQQIRSIENLTKTICKRIEEVRKVKTILDLEHEVDLESFYSPQYVNKAQKRCLVTTIDAIPEKGSIVFRGVAGQGKSVFFRYLAGKAMETGTVLPIFIELRKLVHAETLGELIKNELSILGFSSHRAVLEHLGTHGKLVFFLDAFDEIPQGKQGRTISEIEELVRRYPDSRLFVSSRPNSGVEASSFLRLLEMSYLQSEEYVQLIRKMTDSAADAARIIEGVESSECRIKHLLDTPLMVALLVLRYRIDATIPENEEAFFGDLFDLLLRRHDRSKAGYERPRKSGATDSKLGRFFEGVCFLSLAAQRAEMHRDEVVRFGEKSTMPTIGFERSCKLSIHWEMRLTWEVQTNLLVQ